jgi:membrane associated rhomboid family serine protease
VALADRHYMREGFHPARISRILIIVLLVAFFVQCLLLVYGGIDLADTFALTANGVRHGKIWQLLTFQFLHSCPWPFHVLFNCLGLYFFGRPVEETLGGKRFLQLYLLSGVGGGLLHVLVTLLLPQHPDFPVVGASAGVCGMVAIFCSLYPMQELTTWIYLFPVNIRARYLLIFMGLFSLFGTLVPLGRVAHAAHLGGILVGMGYVRWGNVIGERVSSWMPRQGRPGRRAPAQPAGGRGWWARSRSKSEEPTAQYISQEVDPILDKISAQGIQSLTERERKILDAARKKMGK